jgi:hypothetical protein
MLIEKLSDCGIYFWSGDLSALFPPSRELPRTIFGQNIASEVPFHQFTIPYRQIRSFKTNSALEFTDDASSQSQSVCSGAASLSMSKPPTINMALSYASHQTSWHLTTSLPGKIFMAAGLDIRTFTKTLFMSDPFSHCQESQQSQWQMMPTMLDNEEL